MLTLMTAQPAEAELPRLAALQRIEEDRQGHRIGKESTFSGRGFTMANYAYISERPNGQTMPMVSGERAFSLWGM